MTPRTRTREETLWGQRFLTLGRLYPDASVKELFDAADIAMTKGYVEARRFLREECGLAD